MPLIRIRPLLLALIALALGVPGARARADEPIHEPMTIVAWHNRKTVDLLVGEKVLVKLMCNPGTGYRWHETVSDKGVLVELEPPRFEPFPEDLDDRQKVGKPEMQVFRYVAKKAGTARFSATYLRDSGGRGGKSFEVTIAVQPAEKSTAPCP
jgi:predicted secreted protein